MKPTEMLSQIKTLLKAKVSLAQQTLEDGVTVIEAEAFEKDGNSEFYKYVKFAIRTAEEHLFLMGGKNE